MKILPDFLQALLTPGPARHAEPASSADGFSTLLADGLEAGPATPNADPDAQAPASAQRHPAGPEDEADRAARLLAAMLAFAGPADAGTVPSGSPAPSPAAPDAAATLLPPAPAPAPEAAAPGSQAAVTKALESPDPEPDGGNQRPTDPAPQAKPAAGADSGRPAPARAGPDKAGPPPVTPAVASPGLSRPAAAPQPPAQPSGATAAPSPRAAPALALVARATDAQPSGDSEAGHSAGEQSRKGQPGLARAGNAPSAADFSSRVAEVGPNRLEPSPPLRPAGPAAADGPGPVARDRTLDPDLVVDTPVEVADVVISLDGDQPIGVTFRAADRVSAVRLSAGADSLVADLAALGTEVEAIHVEVRPDRMPESNHRPDGSPGSQPAGGRDGAGRDGAGRDGPNGRGERQDAQPQSSTGNQRGEVDAPLKRRPAGNPSRMVDRYA